MNLYLDLKVKVISSAMKTVAKHYIHSIETENKTAHFLLKKFRVRLAIVCIVAFFLTPKRYISYPGVTDPPT